VSKLPWTPETRDVVVVGGSAGAVTAVRQLVAGLPEDLGAALFVTIHRGNGLPAVLAEILNAAGPLPAVMAKEGQPFARGHIYVASPDHHLIVGRDHVHVRRGPRENRTRPAIDPMFRSAAVSCSTRVIGVLLSGLLNDGTSGLTAIRRCGGLAVVQDPSDALFGDMPRSAIEQGAVDEIAPLAAMGDLLARLTRQRRPPPVEVPGLIRAEAFIAAQELHMDPDNNPIGTLSPLTCPECHGAMYEIRDGKLLRYRCHTGHAYTAESLRNEQAEGWEEALYNALRVQEEQLALTRRMAEVAREFGAEPSAVAFEERARSYAEGVEIIRNLIASGQAGNGAVAELADG
jgi:two-component system chemotaxis response regulator CheB